MQNFVFLLLDVEVSQLVASRGNASFTTDNRLLNVVL